ncbi:MAG: hypothetical protein JAY74_27045 [Candidatus Thiodiazotropha taylori]|nr:hypothetical protein [Candidatus Thiodiazotropha taylori]
MRTVGFKKGIKPHNKGVNYEKEPNVLKNGSKYVRLEQNLHNMVSTKLLPDAKDVSGVPVDDDFRLLRPKKGPGAFVDCLAERETDNWYFYSPSVHFLYYFQLRKLCLLVGFMTVK